MVFSSATKNGRRFNQGVQKRTQHLLRWSPGGNHQVDEEKITNNPNISKRRFIYPPSIYSPSATRQIPSPRHVDHTFSQVIIIMQTDLFNLAQGNVKDLNLVLAPFIAEGSLAKSSHSNFTFKGGQFHCTFLVYHLVRDNPRMVSYHLAPY